MSRLGKIDAFFSPKRTEETEDIWTKWFDLAVTTTANVGVVPSIPRRTNQQQHRDNVQTQTPSDYYKRAVAIPLLDHLLSEMKTYLNPTNDAVLSSLFNLLPELVAVRDRNPDIGAALEFYENNLASPHVVDVELLRWKRKWCSTEDADRPTSAAQTLAPCYREFFPNIHTLIHILCTLSITSAECEHSFNTLRWLKTYLRSTMSSERESGLALININYHRDIYIEEVISTFAQRQPRRLLFA
ncbi:52 kDa repressor of the inhibitor of the protein kinase [Stylophora pistillata]|uniref:52 kDa repressor of the inhibitor of the protein kinase n=1 Tax=Stylophora pistillata TaxID=50429 RepID=A0A2B4S0E9_STYPI|nr:52 kDa repressor of the inhibitor of the protein kinase [Stylophora pistillata]